MTTGNELISARDMMVDNADLLDESLTLELDGCVISIRTNHEALLQQLSRYFAHVNSDNNDADMQVLAIERAVVESDYQFTDWAREPGKKGRKDAYVDLPGGRLVLKVRTGMLFLQSETDRIAAGPCRQYDNQVINFINAQYMNWLQQRGWLICHASAIEVNGHGIGFAGFSGGGKSTLMLHLFENEKVNYLTNDRLFIRTENNQVKARGIPKLPRVNPGTIVHNPKLHDLLSEEQREALLKLPTEELWELEEKYDVDVEQVYGAGRITTQTVLKDFIILNWDRDSQDETRVDIVDIKQRRDLLHALMKSPGPFYQYTDGSFHRDDMAFDEQTYIDALQGISIYEMTGGINFDQAVEQIDRLF